MKGVRVKYDIALAFLEPCPVCGKQPKVYRDYAYENSGFGAWCTIQCKPLFGKAHKTIMCGRSQWKRAFQGGIDLWNEESEVDDGEI